MITVSLLLGICLVHPSDARAGFIVWVASGADMDSGVGEAAAIGIGLGFGVVLMGAVSGVGVCRDFRGQPRSSQRGLQIQSAN